MVVASIPSWRDDAEPEQYWFYYQVKVAKTSRNRVGAGLLTDFKKGSVAFGRSEPRIFDHSM
jgi:hypothetical protein